MTQFGTRKDGKHYPKVHGGYSSQDIVKMRQQDENRVRMEMGTEFARRHVMRVREAARKLDAGLNESKKAQVVGSLRRVESDLDNVKKTIKHAD